MNKATSIGIVVTAVVIILMTTGFVVYETKQTPLVTQQDLGVESISFETKILYIDSSLVDCVGVGPQQCMLIRENPNSKWEFFYDSIEGFEYQEGTEYKISVTITEIENPPADSSSLKYTLIEILESVADSCSLVPDPGLCKAYIPKYYFDKVINSCQEFIWGGCGGVIPFEMMENCTQQCGN